MDFKPNMPIPDYETLMLEHNVGVRINQTIDLKRIDEDFFME